MKWECTGRQTRQTLFSRDGLLPTIFIRATAIRSTSVTATSVATIASFVTIHRIVGGSTASVTAVSGTCTSIRTSASASSSTTGSSAATATATIRSSGSATAATATIDSIPSSGATASSRDSHLTTLQQLYRTILPRSRCGHRCSQSRQGAVVGQAQTHHLALVHHRDRLGHHELGGRRGASTSTSSSTAHSRRCRTTGRAAQRAIDALQHEVHRGQLIAEEAKDVHVLRQGSDRQRVAPA